jgi:C4-dicarboxylate transporter
MWPNWVNLLFLPTTDHWYFVNFYQAPDLPTLQAKGISLKFSNRIVAQLYALYLSPGNASFLLRSKLAELSPVEDKFSYVGVWVREADYLIITTAPVFNVNDFPSIQFTDLEDNHYIAFSDDLKQAAAVLSKCHPVYAITPAKVMKVWSDLEPDEILQGEQLDIPSWLTDDMLEAITVNYDDNESEITDTPKTHS